MSRRGRRLRPTPAFGLVSLVMPTLAPHAHVAAVGDDLVLLDERTDDYACWIGGAVGLTIDASGRLTTPDGELVEALRALDCLSDASPSHRRSTGPVADQDDRAAEPVVPSPRDRLDFIVVSALMPYRYAPSNVGALLRLARRRPASLRIDDRGAAARAALFRRWQPWTPFQGLCLWRSLFVLLFLRRAGLDANWVFGVRTWPFSAHCWIQVGGRVLADDLERVEKYTPILRA